MVKSYKRYHTVLESAERWELSEDPLWISAVFGGRLFWAGSSRARALVQGPILHALSHIQLLLGTLLFPEAFLCSGSTSAGEDVGFGPVWHRDNLGTSATCSTGESPTASSHPLQAQPAAPGLSNHEPLRVDLDQSLHLSISSCFPLPPSCAGRFWDHPQRWHGAAP